MVAFCRIDDRPIRVREPIAEPDALIVQDPTLLHQVDVFDGLRPDGYVLVNTSRSLDELGLGELARRFRPERLLTVPATELAREHLGRPLPNAALLGGFAALTGLVSLESVAAAIRERFPGPVGDGNAAAAAAAYELVRATSSRSRPMLKQIEGSQRRRRGRRAVPAGGDLRLPDLAADAHRRGPVATWCGRASSRPASTSYVESEFAAMSVRDRRLGHRRAHLHRDREPGPALHGRGALQRLRASGCRS